MIVPTHVNASALPRGKMILGVVPSDDFTVPAGSDHTWFYTGPSRHFGHYPPKSKGGGKRR